MIPHGAGRSVWEAEPNLDRTLLNVSGGMRPFVLSVGLQGEPRYSLIPLAPR